MSPPRARARQLLGRIRLVVFDFDGVFTDNRVLVTEEGREAVFCTRADGLGVQLLQRAGVDCLVLSTETNPVVSARCRKLGLPCVQGEWNKAAALERVLVDRGVPAAETAFVGNDVNDVPCLERVGLPIAVADAHRAVKRAARLVTRRRGGEGAVREICEWILEARGIDLLATFRASAAGAGGKAERDDSGAADLRRLSGRGSTSRRVGPSAARTRPRPGKTSR